MDEPPITDRLIGAPDLADFLGLGYRAMNKQRATGVLPDTEIKVDERGTLIWRLSYVLGRLWAQGRYDGPIPEQMDLPDVVSTHYLMERSGLVRRSVQAWAAEPARRARLGLEPDPDPLPEPLFVVSGCPLYDRAAVDAWMVRRGKIREEKVPA